MKKTKSEKLKEKIRGNRRELKKPKFTNGPLSDIQKAINNTMDKLKEIELRLEKLENDR